MHNHIGGKIVRKVSIKNGKGYKSISRYHKKRHTGTIRKSLKRAEINYGGGRRKQKFHYKYSSQCKTEKDREQERLNVLGITPQNWAYRNMQCTPLDEWTDDESDEDN